MFGKNLPRNMTLFKNCVCLINIRRGFWLTVPRWERTTAVCGDGKVAGGKSQVIFLSVTQYWAARLRWGGWGQFQWLHSIFVIFGAPRAICWKLITDLLVWGCGVTPNFGAGEPKNGPKWVWGLWWSKMVRTAWNVLMWEATANIWNGHGCTPNFGPGRVSKP